MVDRDWKEWHGAYEDSSSDLSKRLEIVKGFIRRSLPASPGKSFRILDLCAGNGRDLFETLDGYKFVDMIQARMIELDPELANAAKDRAGRMRLPNVEVIQADAGDTNLFQGIVPADLVMLCGIFGNISEKDIAKTVRTLSTICAEDAKIIWTRNRRDPDMTPFVRSLFINADFVELDFVAPEDVILKFAVGLNQFTGQPQSLQKDQHLFTFV
jgi:SAM-dependent methyltransferase